MMLPRVTRDPVMLQTLDMRQGVWAIDPIARVMKKRERKVLSRPTMVTRFITRSTGILPVGPVGILSVVCSPVVINGLDVCLLHMQHVCTIVTLVMFIGS